MIEVKFTYQDPDGRGRVHDFWRNMIEHIHANGDQDPDSVWTSVDREIKRYRGRFRNGTLYFPRDRDAILFLLRWS